MVLFNNEIDKMNFFFGFEEVWGGFLENLHLLRRLEEIWGEISNLRRFEEMRQPCNCSVEKLVLNKKCRCFGGSGKILLSGWYDELLWWSIWGGECKNQGDAWKKFKELTLISVGFLGVCFGEGVGKITPCLKRDRIMLETWNLI